MTAASIIRQHPTKSAAEVVAICAQQGIKTGVNNVYQIRSNDKRAGKVPVAKKPTAKKRAAPPAGNDSVRAAVERFSAEMTSILKSRAIAAVEEALR